MTKPYCRNCNKKTKSLVFLKINGCIGSKTIFYCLDCFLKWLKENPFEINEFKMEYYELKYSENWS